MTVKHFVNASSKVCIMHALLQDLPCKGRTKEAQGVILAPGDLLIELQETGTAHYVGPDGDL